MKPAASRKLEGLLDDPSIRLADLRESQVEILGVQDDQGSTRRRLGVQAEPPDLPTRPPLDAGLVRPVIVELPAKRRLIEALGVGHVRDHEFDVVDPVVRMAVLFHLVDLRGV